MGTRRGAAHLELGFVDTCVMAIAERHEMPILTFDFTDFRATESAAGPWHLALDEQAYMRAVRQYRGGRVNPGAASP